MAAKKKAAKKKAGGKSKGKPAKQAAARKKAAPKKKAAAKKPKAAPAAPKKKPVTPKELAASVAKTTPVSRPSPYPPPAPAPAPVSTGAFGAHDVNRGHIFSLHPKVNTGFSPEAFDAARRELADARYPTIEAAARAVAERALELSNQRPKREPFPST